MTFRDKFGDNFVFFLCRINGHNRFRFQFSKASGFIRYCNGCNFSRFYQKLQWLQLLQVTPPRYSSYNFNAQLKLLKKSFVFTANMILPVLIFCCLVIWFIKQMRVYRKQPLYLQGRVKVYVHTPLVGLYWIFCCWWWWWWFIK